MRHTLPALLAALLAAPAQAEVAAPPYPLLEYRPVLADYAPSREVGLADWRALNDEVGRLGGHAGHATGDAGHAHRQGGAEATAGQGGAPGHAGHGGGQR
ncbi:MAG: hypothetical protein HXY24_16125 [Rubrivivax sp.]|nr:hypothetical protein [Rubrivivax sp.]